MRTILLLTIPNIFMIFAWYGHLKYKDSPARPTSCRLRDDWPDMISAPVVVNYHDN
jgi:hypothetical protein